MFDELSYTPDECIKCVSLLKDTAYHWWNTLVSVVPKERVTWEFILDWILEEIYQLEIHRSKTQKNAQVKIRSHDSDRI